MIWIPAYLLAGTLIGFLAGLLGIGGGMALVPILSALFAAQALSPEHGVHLALGTGMASVLFTSSASVREHHRQGKVDWSIVRRMVPGMVAGTLLSSFGSGWLSQRALAIAFSIIVFFGATQILLGRRPKAGRTLPGPVGLFLCGLVIGTICGLVSAGGAFLTIPFMLFCGIAMHSTIGTAAAIGLPVALIGTIGFIAAGLRVADLPDCSLGFVYLPALVPLVAGSMVTAPIGARATHRMPVVTLRRVFAALLYVLALTMLLTYV